MVRVLLWLPGESSDLIGEVSQESITLIRQLHSDSDDQFQCPLLCLHPQHIATKALGVGRSIFGQVFKRHSTVCRLDTSDAPLCLSRAVALNEVDFVDIASH